MDLSRAKEYRKKIEDLENKTSLQKPKLGIDVHLNFTRGKTMSKICSQYKLTRPLRRSGNQKNGMRTMLLGYITMLLKAIYILLI